MRTAVVLFNRDLRVHDHPALAAAARAAEHVVPVFVWDDALLASQFAAPNRLRFLLDSLEDLDAALHSRGAGLVVRRGDVVREVIALARDTAAGAIFTSDDVSAYARARLARLGRAGAQQGIAVFRSQRGHLANVGLARKTSWVETGIGVCPLARSRRSVTGLQRKVAIARESLPR